jgi:hypothetical protein
MAEDVKKPPDDTMTKTTSLMIRRTSTVWTIGLTMILMTMVGAT